MEFSFSFYVCIVVHVCRLCIMYVYIFVWIYYVVQAS
jgi:hypothetical protein